MVTMAGPVPIPHVGGPILPPGCPTVLIGKLPAAVVGCTHTKFPLPTPNIFCQNSPVRNLTATICLTVAVLLGSAGVSWSAENISGTNWRVVQDNGHKYVYSFNPDGNCTYYQEVSPSGNEGKIYNNCRWIQNDSVLVFNANGYFSVNIAIIAGKL